MRLFGLLVVICAALCVALLDVDVSAASEKWKPVNSPVKTTLRAVYFADSKTVFAVGDGGTILVSRDGGKRWKQVKSPSAATLRGVHFVDRKHGWIVGDGDPSAPRARGHVVMGRPFKCGTCLITEDGGKKWETVWVHTNFELRSIWMASKKVGQICNHGGEDHPDGDRIITTDGGRTWSQRRVFRGLNDCCWVSEKEGWAVGSRVTVGFIPTPKSPLYTHKTARIIHTSDGGKNWEPQDAEGISGRSQLRSVWFSDKKHGCTVGDGGAILFTSDGGRKWTLSKKVTEKALYAVCLTDKKNGWAVGEEGTILKTTDGGEKWKVVKSPTKKTLYGLHFNEKGDVGIAVGAEGVIVRLAR